MFVETPSSASPQGDKKDFLKSTAKVQYNIYICKGKAGFGGVEAGNPAFWWRPNQWM